MIKLNEEHTTLRTLFIFIAIAYLFSLSMRFIWVNEMSAFPQFFWNNELMINTNDGYFLAEGARDILIGHHNENDQSPINDAPSKLTAILSQILPVSFETLILYMPAFLGSLIVIPLILIGRALNQTTMGFIAALIGSIAHSYYNRTMTGYYDTDMLNIVFPTLEMYTLILALTHQRNRYLIPITISIALYQWWYPQAYALDTAFFGMIVGYTLIFDRKNLYLYKIALFILIGILALPISAKVSLAVALFALFHYKKDLSTKFFMAIFGIIIALYFATGGFDLIWHMLKGYVFKGSEENIVSDFHYFNVVSTVREAGSIPFTLFAERISGHTLTFIAACIGYIMAIIAYRPLLITLPLVGLGFIAMSSGLRFTIYAVPPMAIGIGFLIVYLSRFIQHAVLRYSVILVLTAAILYPNYLHIKEYMTPPVFTSNEVAALDQLGKLSSGEDYVVTWWDYGFPIRYYADVKTWADGAQHSGGQNFPLSLALCSDNKYLTAHLLRANSEYMERTLNDKNSTSATFFEYMMKHEGFKDPNAFITAMSKPEYKTPQKTRDVYLYLPLRMLEIFPTVALFSNLDLTNPEYHPDHFYYASRSIQETEKTIELGQGVSIVKANSTLKIGEQSLPIKTFYQAGYDTTNHLKVTRQTYASEGLNVIFLSSYGQFLIVDDFYLNSTYFQMFLFEQYDKNLFTPVILGPMAKIYKLKI